MLSRTSSTDIWQTDRKKKTFQTVLRCRQTLDNVLVFISSSKNFLKRKVDNKHTILTYKINNVNKVYSPVCMTLIFIIIE